MLSNRVANALAKKLGRTPEELTRRHISNLSWQELRRTPGIGEKALREIKAHMKQGGFVYSRSHVGWTQGL